MKKLWSGEQGLKGEVVEEEDYKVETAKFEGTWMTMMKKMTLRA